MDQSAILQAMLAMGMEPAKAGQTIAEMAMITANSKPSDADTCAVCGGDGWILHEGQDGYRSSEKCQCRIAQEAERRIRNSGLSQVLDGWTFDAFKAEQPFQQMMKDTSLRYAKHIMDGGTSWLFMGGQVGSGKSHLCTAVCGELLKHGKSVRYMRWLTDVGHLKGIVNEREAFEEDIAKYKTAQVLYVDDLFKMQHLQGQRPRPTEADIKVAFELFDYRYADRKPTIITSEWFMPELMVVDAGTFSRMYEMVKGYLVEITPGKGKNWRTM